MLSADDALVSIYRRHLRGDESTNQVIASAMYLVDAAVATAIRKYPPASRLADDLRSEGYLALTQACGELTVPEDKVVAYLAKAARYAVLDAIAAEFDSREPQMESLSEASEPAAPEDRSGELLDDILACCGDETDRSIVRLRAESRSDAEVASLVGLSESAVRNRRKAIETRFIERNPEYQQ